MLCGRADGWSTPAQHEEMAALSFTGSVRAVFLRSASDKQAPLIADAVSMEALKAQGRLMAYPDADVSFRELSFPRGATSDWLGDAEYVLVIGAGGLGSPPSRRPRPSGRDREGGCRADASDRRRSRDGHARE